MPQKSKSLMIMRRKRDVVKVDTLIPDEMSGCNGVVSCVNLWRRRGGDGLSPAPRPVTLADGAWVPLMEWRGNSREAIIAKRGCDVGVICEGGVQRVATLESEAACAVSYGTDSVVLMTAEGPDFIDYDAAAGLWHHRGPLPKFPAVRFVARKLGRLSAEVPQYLPKDGDLRRARVLGLSDEKALKASLLGAYGQLCATASAAGGWIQPVMMRCRYVDDGGGVLYESVPVAVMLPDGGACIEPVDVAVSKRSLTDWTIEPFALEADVFDVSVVVPRLDIGARWAARVAAIEILATPQLHPVDGSSLFSYRAMHPSSNEPLLRVTLPRNASYGNAAALGRLVDRFDEAADVVTRIKMPHEGGTVTLTNDRAATPDDECARVNAVLERRMPAVDARVRSFGAPHGFAASVCVSSGDAVVWGNVTRIPGTIADLSEYSLTCGDGAWTGCIEVVGASGLIAVNHIEGSAGAPLLFSPLLAYPDARATELRIYVRAASGAVMTGRFDLVPTADGGHAVYVDAGFKPVALVDVADSLPAQLPVEIPRAHLPGTIISATSANPLMPVSVLTVCADAISAITPAARSQSSWDFSRSHLYAFARSGIYAVSVGTSRRLVSSTLIDVRGIDSRCAPAFTPNGVVAATEHELLCVSGARARGLMRMGGVIGTGYDSSSGRLWAAVGGDALVSVDLDRLTVATHVGAAGLGVSVKSPGATAYLCGSDALMACADAVAAENEVRWALRRNIAGGRLVAVEVGVRASNFTGCICLMADDCLQPDCAAPMISRFDVDGSVVSPLRFKVAMPRRRYLTISLEGQVSTDFEFNYVKMEMV